MFSWFLQFAQAVSYEETPSAKPAMFRPGTGVLSTFVFEQVLHVQSKPAGRAS